MDRKEINDIIDIERKNIRISNIYFNEKWHSPTHDKKEEHELYLNGRILVIHNNRHESKRKHKRNMDAFVNILKKLGKF